MLCQCSPFPLIYQFYRAKYVIVCGQNQWRYACRTKRLRNQKSLGVRENCYRHRSRAFYSKGVWAGCYCTVVYNGMYVIGWAVEFKKILDLRFYKKFVLNNNLSVKLNYKNWGFAFLVEFSLPYSSIGWAHRRKPLARN